MMGQVFETKRPDKNGGGKKKREGLKEGNDLKHGIG